VRARTNIILLAIVVLLVVVPVALRGRVTGSSQGRFIGSDTRAQEAVSEIAPSYAPWFRLPIVPPSPQAESALFALQAALGAGFLGYYLWARRGSKRSAGVPDDD